IPAASRFFHPLLPMMTPGASSARSVVRHGSSLNKHSTMRGTFSTPQLDQFLDQRRICIGLRSNCYSCPTVVGLRSAHGWQQRQHNSVKLHASTGICTHTGAQLSARRCEEGTHMRFRRLFYTLVLATFLASAVVTGCAPVTVQQTTLKNTYTDVRAD